jgi:hypothetical protein
LIQVKAGLFSPCQYGKNGWGSPWGAVSALKWQAHESLKERILSKEKETSHGKRDFDEK